MTVDYSKAALSRDVGEVTKLLGMFRTEVSRMPTVSIVRIELSLAKELKAAGSQPLVWDEGKLEGLLEELSVREFNTKLLTEWKSKPFSLVYNLCALNRNLSYVHEIHELLVFNVHEGYSVQEGSHLYVSGEDRFGSYWSELRWRADETLRYSGTRPLPFGRIVSTAADALSGKAHGW